MLKGLFAALILGILIIVLGVDVFFGLIIVSIMIGAILKTIG